VLTPALTYRVPWYGKLLFTFIFPKFKQVARKGMRINEETVAQSLRLLETSVRELNQHLEHRQFMVGNTFTRADLAIASQFSPLVAPPDSYFIWWDFMPEVLQTLRAQYKNERVFRWVNEIYLHHR
jgi:glutathione S-transferase